MKKIGQAVNSVQSRKILLAFAGLSSIFSKVLSVICESARQLVATALLLLITVVMSGTVVSAQAQTIDDLLIAEAGAQLGQQVGDLYNSYQGVRVSAAKLSARITQARQQFWATYPDKPGHEEAKVAFSKLLFEKDYVYLYYGVLGEFFTKNTRSPYNKTALAIDRMNAMFGEIDGSIRPETSKEFIKWAEAYKKNLSRAMDGNLFNLSLSAIVEAFKESQDEYAWYAHLRDVIEFYEAGVPLPGSKKLQGYASSLVVHVKACQSINVYESMVAVFGAEHVNKTLQLVRDAPKGEGGFIADLPALGLFKGVSWQAPDRGKPIPDGMVYTSTASPAGVFFALLTQGTPERYLLGLNPRKCFLDFNADTYQYYAIIYGKTALHNAVNRLQNAPKMRGGNGIIDYKKLGLDKRPPRLDLALREMLNKDPEGYARSLVWQQLKDEGIESPSALQIGAAYEELVEKYGEDAVQQAAVEVRNMSHEERRQEGYGHVLLNRLRTPEANNPEYKYWADEREGMTATYSKNRQKSQFNTIYTVRFTGSDDREAKLHITENRLSGGKKSGDPKKRDYIVEAWRDNTEWYFPLTDIFFHYKTRKHHASTENERRQEGPRVSEDVVEVEGRNVRCQREDYDYGDGYLTAACYSDEVPGGLVYFSGGKPKVTVQLQSFGMPSSSELAELAKEEAHAEAKAASEKSKIETACGGEVFDPSVTSKDFRAGIRGAGLIEKRSELQKRLLYSEAARKDGAFGFVGINYIVDRQGKVFNITCGDMMVSPDKYKEAFCQEAKRLISTAEFKPGYKIGGGPVCVKSGSQISFRRQ